MNETLSELRSKPHWSFSSLNGFLNICSLQWAFKYIYALEPESTPVSLLFGSAFHKSASWIATLRQQSTYETTEEAQEVFSEAWKIECKTLSKVKISTDGYNRLNATGRKMIDCLSRKWMEDNIVAVGKAFTVPIEGSSKPLIGEIDLAVKSEANSTILVDWKTSQNKWPEGKADKDLQATCFCYANKKLTDTDCLFRYDVVTKAKEPSYTQHYTYRTQDDFKRLSQLIRIAERAIKAEVFMPNETSFYCSSCAYISACKSWHRQQSKTISLPIAV